MPKGVEINSTISDRLNLAEIQCDLIFKGPEVSTPGPLLFNPK